MFQATVRFATAVLLSATFISTEFVTFAHEALVQPQNVVTTEAGKAKPKDARLEPISWKEKTSLKTPGILLGSAAFSPDGKTIIAGGTWGVIGDTGKVIAYDTAGFKEKWIADVGGNFAAVAFSADGKSVLATVRDGVTLLDIATGKPITSVIEKDCAPIAVGAFPDRELAVGARMFASFCGTRKPATTISS